MNIAIGMPGAGEWLIILVIVVIFFGVGKLPDVLGQMGKGVRAFKEGMDPRSKPREIELDEADVVAGKREQTAEREERS